MSDERNCRLLECLEDKEFLGNWISNMENLVKAVEDALCYLEDLRDVLISQLKQLQVAELHTLHVLPDII